MKQLGQVIKHPTTFYLTGGTSAVLFGIRTSTIDIDISGNLDEIFSDIPRLKNRLNVNIEIAKPTDFVPALEGEEKRHVLIGRFGKATFYHFDPYSQVFSKIVRGHHTDIGDAKVLIEQGLVEPSTLLQLVTTIPPDRFARYTRLDRESVLESVRGFIRSVK